MKIISTDEAIKRIRQIVAEEGTQYAAAERLGISAMYLSDILNRKRGISENLARRLGLERKVVFEERG